jgi:hypothetical protein
MPLQTYDPLVPEYEPASLVNLLRFCRVWQFVRSISLPVASSYGCLQPVYASFLSSLFARHQKCRRVAWITPISFYIAHSKCFARGCLALPAWVYPRSMWMFPRSYLSVQLTELG